MSMENWLPCVEAASFTQSMGRCLAVAVAQASEGILLTFDRALASQGVYCLLPKRG
jgi:hypothetical protein